MPMQAVIQKIVDWLTAGYPNGVPERDYVPLFALLARRLTDEEVEAVTEELAHMGRLQGAVTVPMVKEALTTVTEQPALESDVERVSEHLAAVGWVTEPSTSSD